MLFRSVSQSRYALQDSNKVMDFQKYPEDCELYSIGTFDKETGIIVPNKTPEHVLNIVALKRS